MTTLAKVKKSALALTTAERILLVQDIWDSIVEEDAAAVRIPREHKTLISARLRAHQRDPSQIMSWAQVKRKIESALARKRKR